MCYLAKKLRIWNAPFFSPLFFKINYYTWVVLIRQLSTLPSYSEISTVGFIRDVLYFCWKSYYCMP